MLKNSLKTLRFNALTNHILRSFAKCTIKLPPVKTHLIKKSSYPTKATLTTDEAMDMLRDMLTIRRMEINCDKLYKGA